MIRVGELTVSRLADWLRTDGIHLCTGVFTTWVRSDVPAVATEMRELYGDYAAYDSPVVDDFSVAIWRSRRIAHVVRPQVEASIEESFPFQPMPARFAPMLLESTLNWAIGLHLYRHLLLHAAVVERHGVAMILAGDSGSGKSTLSAALTVRGGWRLFSDEVGLVRAADGMAIPNPRPISLKNDAIDLIRKLAPEAYFTRRFHGTIKGSMAYMRAKSEDVARGDDVAPPGIIVFPRYRPGADQTASIAEIGRIDCFTRLVDQAVNYDALHRVGFDTVSRLIDRCDAYALDFSDLEAAISTLNDICEARRSAGCAA